MGARPGHQTHTLTLVHHGSRLSSITEEQVQIGYNLQLFSMTNDCHFSLPFSFRMRQVSQVDNSHSALDTFIS